MVYFHFHTNTAKKCKSKYRGKFVQYFQTPTLCQVKLIVRKFKHFKVFAWQEWEVEILNVQRSLSLSAVQSCQTASCWGVRDDRPSLACCYCRCLHNISWAVGANYLSLTALYLRITRVMKAKGPCFPHECWEVVANIQLKCGFNPVQWVLIFPAFDLHAVFTLTNPLDPTRTRGGEASLIWLILCGCQKLI